MSLDLSHDLCSLPSQYRHQEKPLSLLGGLYGVLPYTDHRRASAFLITIDYKTSPRGCSEWANSAEFTLIAANKDRDAVLDVLGHTGLEAENIKCLSNEKASNLNIKYELNRLGHTPGPTTIYIQGHGLELLDNRIEFLPHDYHTSTPPRGITCHDFQSALSPRRGVFSAQRLIITDFCHGYNFNHLPYILKFDQNELPYWDTTDDWQDSSYGPSFSDTVVHFAAGSRGGVTYENNSGGIFTQVVCQIMKEPQTLPELLGRVRKGINRYIYEHNYNISQVPQIYSSHKLDLCDQNILRSFGWFGPGYQKSIKC